MPKVVGGVGLLKVWDGGCALVRCRRTRRARGSRRRRRAARAATRRRRRSPARGWPAARPPGAAAARRACPRGSLEPRCLDACGWRFGREPGEPERARGEPPAPGGLMPAPNRAASPEASCDVGAPVRLAWFSGRAYSLAAGEPGLTWTPGSRPVAVCATALAEHAASTTSAASAPATATPTARMIPST